MHRVTRLLPFALAAAAFGGHVATAGASESLKLDLSDPANANSDPAGSPLTSSTLEAGAKYVLIVTGTGSIWEPKAFTSRGTCGVADKSPMFLSPNRTNSVAAWDAAVVYAAPAGADVGPFGSDCKTLALPKSVIGPTGDRRASGGGTAAGFEFSVGKEDRYARFAPIGGVRTTPRIDRTYFWSIVGAGKPLHFRFADSPSADNSGVFAISILTEAECAAKNCTARAGAEFDQQVPPADAISGATGQTGLTPGVGVTTAGGNTGGTGGTTTPGIIGPISVPVAANQSVKVTGTRTCKANPTVTVRLNEPNGVDFRKVTYFFSGVKKRVLYRTTKKTSRLLIYTAGKKKGQIKPQKFTGLVSRKQYRLSLQITTTANQSLTARRTIPACTKTKKTRSFS